jgi:hypothetical protein
MKLWPFIRRPHEQWKLVKSIKLEIVRNKTDEGKFFYHLHESDRGNRKVDYTCTFPVINSKRSSLHQLAITFDDYHEQVYPWLQGRYVAVIPSFAEVDLLDVQAKLSA